jgi:hypothetical protein
MKDKLIDEGHHLYNACAVLVGQIDEAKSKAILLATKDSHTDEDKEMVAKTREDLYRYSEQLQVVNAKIGRFNEEIQKFQRMAQDTGIDGPQESGPCGG